MKFFDAVALAAERCNSEALVQFLKVDDIALFVLVEARVCTGNRDARQHQLA